MYVDTNGNGKRDATEPGVANIKVSVYVPPVPNYYGSAEDSQPHADIASLIHNGRGVVAGVNCRST